jgi:hypothetical protein
MVLAYFRETVAGAVEYYAAIKTLYCGKNSITHLTEK